MYARVTSALLLFCFVAVAASSALGQEHQSKWQVGTIMAVAKHPGADEQHPRDQKYDVSVKVGQTMYVVVYTPPDGSDTITHRAGLDLLVSVGAKTIAFNNLLGRKIEVPIISQKPLTLTAQQ